MITVRLEIGNNAIEADWPSEELIVKFLYLTAQCIKKYGVEKTFEELTDELKLRGASTNDPLPETQEEVE